MNFQGIPRSAGDVASEIAMSRLNWTGSFLVVEGPSDSKFWRPRKSEFCEIVIAMGRHQVLGSVQLACDSGMRGVLGIVDDDFDTLLGEPHQVRNVVSTEPRDLEGTLLRSRALDRVVGELGDETKLKAFLAREGLLRDALLSRAGLFGRLRWLAFTQPKPLDLKPLKPSRFVDLSNWTYDTQAILAEAVRLGLATDVPSLSATLATLPPKDPWHTCRGHDLIEILAHGFRCVIGSTQVDADEICSLLRAGMDDTEFRTGRLWADLSRWEQDNASYLILRR